MHDSGELGVRADPCLSGIDLHGRSAMQYSWKRCATETLTFVASCVARKRS